MGRGGGGRAIYMPISTEGSGMPTTSSKTGPNGLGSRGRKPALIKAYYFRFVFSSNGSEC